MALTHAELGTIAVHLAATFPVWVRRRKTAFSLLDDSSVLSRQSVDFGLRDEHFPPGHVPGIRERIYVPIEIPPKDPLTSFSITDEDGRPLSVLNTVENGTLTVAGLNAFVDGATAGQPVYTAGQFLPALTNLVFATDVEAGTAAHMAATAQLAPALPAGAVIFPLMKELSSGFLLLVPVEYVPDQHRLLKIDLIAPLEVTNRGLGGTVRTAAASVGLAPWTLRFSNRPIGWARGTHFELAEPEDLRLIQTRLAVRQYVSPARGHVRQPRRRVAYGRSPANLNVSVVNPANPLSARTDAADIEVRLRSRPGGAFLSVLVTTVIAGGVMVALSPRLGRLDGQTSAAVLLVVPALLFGYLNRPGEHAIASRLLIGVRVLGLVAALAALAAAVLIGSGGVTEPAGRSVQRVDCAPVTDTIGPPTRRREVLRDLDCAITERPAAAPRVTREARLWMDRFTRVAVLVAIALLVAAAINALVVASMQRRHDVTNRTT